MPASPTRPSFGGSSLPPASPSSGSAAASTSTLSSWRARPLRKGPLTSGAIRTGSFLGGLSGQSSPPTPPESSLPASPRPGTPSSPHEDERKVPSSTTIVRRAGQLADLTPESEGPIDPKAASRAAAAAAAEEYFYAMRVSGAEWARPPPAGSDGTAPLKPAPRSQKPRSESNSSNSLKSGMAFSQHLSSSPSANNTWSSSSRAQASSAGRSTMLGSPTRSTILLGNLGRQRSFDASAVSEEAAGAYQGGSEEQRSVVDGALRYRRSSAQQTPRLRSGSVSATATVIASNRGASPSPRRPSSPSLSTWASRWARDVPDESQPRSQSQSTPLTHAPPGNPVASTPAAPITTLSSPLPTTSNCSHLDVPTSIPALSTKKTGSPTPCTSPSLRNDYEEQSPRQRAFHSPSLYHTGARSPPTTRQPLTTCVDELGPLKPVRGSSASSPRVNERRPSSGHRSIASPPSSYKEKDQEGDEDTPAPPPADGLLKPLPPPFRAGGLRRPSIDSLSSASPSKKPLIPLSAFIDPVSASGYRLPKTDEEGTSMSYETTGVGSPSFNANTRRSSAASQNDSLRKLNSSALSQDTTGQNSTDSGTSQLGAGPSITRPQHNGAAPLAQSDTHDTDRALFVSQDLPALKRTFDGSSLSHKDSFGGFRSESAPSAAMSRLTSADTSNIDRVSEEAEDNVETKTKDTTLSGEAGGSTALHNNLRTSQDSAESRINRSADYTTSMIEKGPESVALSQANGVSRSGSSGNRPVVSGQSIAAHWPRRAPTEAGPASSMSPSGATITRPRNESTTTSSKDRSEQRLAASSRRDKGSSRHTGKGESGRTSSQRLLKPNFPSAPVAPAPPPLMYWSRAPVHGAVPKRSFRAHTATLCDDTMWLFGGCDSRGCFSSLWCFDIETMCWSRPKVTGDCPTPRRAHSTTVVDKRLYVFAGGDGPHYFQDLYVFDIVALKWTKPDVYGALPPPRRAHTANYWNGHIVIFGGGNGVGGLNDIWLLDVRDPDRLEWKKMECAGKVPVGRGYHSGNIVDDKLIIIGGSDGHMSFNDIHVLKLDGALTLGASGHLNPTWYQVKTDERHNRLGHTSTQVGSYLFVFGGHDSNEYTGELMTLNLVNLQWESRRACGKPPAGRGYHQAWLKDSRLFIHGGFDGREIFDDLYYLDLAASSYLPQITQFEVSLENEEEEFEIGEEEEEEDSSGFDDGAGHQYTYSEDGTTDEENAMRNAHAMHGAALRGAPGPYSMRTGDSGSSNGFPMARGASGGPLTTPVDLTAGPLGVGLSPTTPPHSLPPVASPFRGNALSSASGGTGVTRGSEPSIVASGPAVNSLQQQQQQQAVRSGSGSINEVEMNRGADVLPGPGLSLRDRRGMGAASATVTTPPGGSGGGAVEGAGKSGLGRMQFPPRRAGGSTAPGGAGAGGGAKANMI
ncbi:hypothetical protein BCV69DRAFT_256621 [Microstroma glucosiphilum]|uniref:Galactose oxidase n=1 Tax=Pseudomicrostroma glucosiphilum TaxID=1684307 RepID=A0A316UGD4_9BASI|nr:hypothetical protein BCV69DRAFT_256621 [Pseudomicrostroma glucosiphilum]PWN23421.1 hypothetical protein BCV69DRAFT_256621 [Pseudomicrostroma glucosiphilum]